MGVYVGFNGELVLLKPSRGAVCCHFSRTQLNNFMKLDSREIWEINRERQSSSREEKRFFFVCDVVCYSNV